MRRLMTWAAAVVLSAGVLSLGCGGGDTKTGGGSGDSKKADGGGKDVPKGAGKTASTPVDFKETGTLKGKITLKGTPPGLATLNADIQKLLGEKDKDRCLAHDAPPEMKEQQVWRIGKDNALGNVFVWVAPPDGKYFRFDKADVEKMKLADATIDQPYCAYVPHAFVMFTEYHPDPNNPKKTEKTGQKLIVKNSSTIQHNTNWAGQPDNPGNNVIIAPKETKPIDDLVPSKTPIEFKCNIHAYMKGWARDFDHPYAAVTNSDGTYEIKNVPAGVELNVVVWHEEADFVNGKKGEPITLKAGDNTKDFVVEPKAK